MKRSRASVILICAALALGLVALLGSRWLALFWSASHYPTATASARTQAVVNGGHAYIAAGAEGIEVIDLATQERRRLVPPSAPADRIDDLAVADGLLFALDATPPGHLMTYSLADPEMPSLSGDIVPVPVGPFSGVSAAAGVVIVSGGTSELTLREYDRKGRFGKEVAKAEVAVDDAHPTVSLVAMIAPSPDWFAGVDVNLMENGAWVDSKTVDVNPWDSGGDDGTTYLADDKDTNPKKPTTSNQSKHFMKDGKVMPVARLTFTRM